MKDILQFFPDEALLELAAATNEHRFYTHNTFFQKILVATRIKGRIFNSMVQKRDHATEKYAGYKNCNFSETLSIFQDAVT